MTKLHKGDDAFRDFALHANLWRVLWKVCLPLSLYAVLNFVFKILDTMMASHISAASVSTVAYLSQISTMLSPRWMYPKVGVGIRITMVAAVVSAASSAAMTMRLVFWFTILERLLSVFLLCLQYSFNLVF